MSHPFTEMDHLQDRADQVLVNVAAVLVFHKDVGIVFSE